MIAKKPPKVPPAVTRPYHASAAIQRLTERYPVKREGVIVNLWQTAEIVKKAAKRPLDEQRANELIAAITKAFSVYRNNQFFKDAERTFTLHEIASSLAEVIVVLEHLENIPYILVALGAPAVSVMFDFGPDKFFREAMAHYEIMRLSLRKIRDTIPTPPKNPKGKPPARNLHQLGDRLADIWETFTEREFTQGWHKEKGESKPTSDGARFVHAVVKVVDPERLKSVPDVTEQVVKRRRSKPTSVK
jgi:hypothetical protein